MASTVELVVREFTDDDRITRIGLTRELVRESGERSRTKGGIWAVKSDRASLELALEGALAFAQACDDAIKALDAAPKPAPKAPRAPRNAPPAPTPVVRNPAPAKTPASKPTPDATAVAANRAIAIANARASKPAPAPSTHVGAVPTGDDWFMKLMHDAGAA